MLVYRCVGYIFTRTSKTAATALGISLIVFQVSFCRQFSFEGVFPCIFFRCVVKKGPLWPVTVTFRPVFDFGYKVEPVGDLDQLMRKMCVGDVCQPVLSIRQRD